LRFFKADETPAANLHSPTSVYLIYEATAGRVAKQGKQPQYNNGFVGITRRFPLTVAGGVL